jgi:hypothetical protein
MEKSNKYFIECTKEQYPEVKRLLESIGYVEIDGDWHDWITGVAVYIDRTFQTFDNRRGYHTLTISELSKMSEPNNNLNWLTDRITKYEHQLRDAFAAEEKQECLIIAARLQELEYVYRKLKG